MNNEEELEIKSKVRIFQSEKEINGNYSVISHVTYKPILIPLFSDKKKEYLKTLYETAAKQAYKLGGNGVIITSHESYKVISIDNWDSDKEKSMAYLNMIYDTSLMEKFNNGTIEKAKRREAIRYV
ncbi:MAG: hypothetical protein J6U55_01750, partial [Bacteroidaceae bacterium]|nr:hypothetical protein [Bacteroidaceae bacterium]